MVTVMFTAAEAQAVAETILAWGADDCPVGAIDTEALRIANDKLAAAIGSDAEAAQKGRGKAASEAPRAHEPAGVELADIPGRQSARRRVLSYS